jgi:stearoyl-CoA desaturase (delta-9 desaturase)
MPILIFFVAHYYLSLFTQTFYLHRYAAHKMFTMNKFWEKFFYLFTYACQGSSFLSPRAYAILHRMHHAYSDTEMDPHSPHFSSNPFAMMWKTKVIYTDLLKHNVEAPERFEGDYPVWEAVENFGSQWYSRLGWGTAFLMGPLHGAIVNWGGHKYGYQNFDNHDKSKNTLALDFLAFGELFQNNHHKLPLRVNFGVKWWEFDPTYMFIWGMDKVGVIKIKRKQSAPVRVAA